jgi:hypothetical protein
MTSLPQTALEFAREVMGWGDANIEFGSDGVIWNGKLKEGFAGFHYSDLNAIMAAVRIWCDANSHRLEISSNQGNGGTRWLVRIKYEGDDRGFQGRDDLAHALLAACVEAARKLKAT